MYGLEIKSLKRVVLLLITLFTVHYSSAQEETNESNQCFYVGVNLATPLGAYYEKRTSYEYTYYYPLSYLGSNLCVSFHGEYRYKYVGLEVPVRFALDHLDMSDFVTGSAYYYYSNYGIFNNNYEVGVKPKFYFQPQQKMFQYFISLGAIFGEAQGSILTTYEQYGLNTTSGEYTDNNTYTRWAEAEDADPNNYSRYFIGCGSQVQFKNGLGILAELNMGRGLRVNHIEVRYSNYGTTSPVPVVENEYAGSYRGNVVQFNLSLTYKFDR